jgi:4-amino-4-deoxy-L-arabinose transferase-like glycosyltransferase
LTDRGRLLAWSAAVVSTVAIALAVPYHLTDGDSCAYAAMAHDIARGVSSWCNPQWDFHGRIECFHEHPPGALWLSALVERLGAPEAKAALVANVLWTFAAMAGVVALARRFVSKGAADLAGLVFVLHVGVMHYVQRAALEIPLAATAAWTVAAGLRLGGSRWWTVATAASLAGAILVRGVFGLVPAALLVFLLFEPTLRPPWRRLVVAFLGAAAALCAFDLAHVHKPTGPSCLPIPGVHVSFWREYLERQVLPSLQPGGTAHSVAGETWTYYVGRTLVYSLPWTLLPVWRLVRGPKPLPSPAAWRLAAVWIVLTVAGASMSSREGSRYVFQVYAATSLLAALAVGPELKPVVEWIAVTFVVMLFPAQVLLKSTVFHARDVWWRTAEIASAHAYRNGELWPPGSRRTVAGPFQPEDDRLKSLLRFHLGDVWVSSAPVTDAKGLQWVPGAGEDFPLGKVVFATPLGALVDYGR